MIRVVEAPTKRISQENKIKLKNQTVSRFVSILKHTLRNYIS